MDKNIIKECEFTIHGMPKSKSNHSLVNRDGKKILPKNSQYALYEKQIVNSVLDQVGEAQFVGKVFCVLNVFFKHKERHPDLNNMTKSICDGIEKSSIISNDKDIVAVYMEEHYDYDNPRVEVGIYDYLSYKPTFKVNKRPNNEIKDLEEMYKKKKRTKKDKGNSGLHCFICGKETDVDHAKLVLDNSSKKKSYACFGCILSGY